MKLKIVSLLLNVGILILSLIIFYILYKAFWVEPDRKLYFLSHFFILLPIFLFTFFCKISKYKISRKLYYYYFHVFNLYLYF